MPEPQLQDYQRQYIKRVYGLRGRLRLALSGLTETMEADISTEFHMSPEWDTYVKAWGPYRTEQWKMAHPDHPENLGVNRR